MYVLVYVDDIIMATSSPTDTTTLLKALDTDFMLKDLGELHFFLSIEVTKNLAGLSLSQGKYVEDLLKIAGMVSCKPINTPLWTLEKLSAHVATLLRPNDATSYCSLVGSLQYLTLTRAEIAFSMNKVCQYLYVPTTLHLVAVKRILRYVRGTTDMGLQIVKLPSMHMHGFSDDDWAGSLDDRHSTGGFAIFLGSNLVSWSAEAEYKALANAMDEIMWLQTLLAKLGIPHRLAVSLWCDNLGATYLSASPVFHVRTKHVEVHYDFVRERVARKQLDIWFISTHDQIVDGFTKPLSTKKLFMFQNNLNLRRLRLREGVREKNPSVDTPS
jgi:hypothetical protein